MRLRRRRRLRRDVHGHRLLGRVQGQRRL
jgi:hypothetical protein